MPVEEAIATEAQSHCPGITAIIRDDSPAETGSLPPSDDYQLIGVSLQTVLHFSPRATLAQQEAAIEKTVKVVGDEIVRTEVDATFRVNDLWVILRFLCQDVVVDAGEPSRPFEEILLWRGGKSEPLVGNYILKPGERLVVEPSHPAAIDIRPAA